MAAELYRNLAQRAPGLHALRAAGRSVLDLVLPPRLHDGAGPALSGGLSAQGWARIRFLDDPVCDGCGAPFAYASDLQGRCAACQARPRAFDRARAACLYDEASRDLILQLKHADRTELAGLLALWLSRAAGPLLREAHAVVPVPLARGRLFRRRYNQAAEMARPLARRGAVPYLPDTLVRLKGDSQAGKSAAGRRRGVQGAFAVPDAKRRRIEGRRILLVDDVLTTGATAEACARALKKAGAASVDLVVVARVQEADVAA
jgi:ComF family protein